MIQKNQESDAAFVSYICESPEKFGILLRFIVKFEQWIQY